MTEIEKTVLVGYSSAQMFHLVDTVENYPDFLPWCSGASMNIDYHLVKHSFTTRNKRHPPDLIEMELLEGPFEKLNGYWRFIPLTDTACKIEFKLHYTFSHKLLEKLIGPVFYIIANSFVEAFVERAEEIYGPSI